MPGQSTVQDVEAVMGAPADKRASHGGETVYWYPQLPWGKVSYAARIGPDGHLIALEQRLTEQNTEYVVKGSTTATDVYDLLGPPYQPIVIDRLQREIWTYPMRQAGYFYPRWFIVQFSLGDHVVREAFMMDDVEVYPKGAFRH